MKLKFICEKCHKVIEASEPKGNMRKWDKGFKGGFGRWGDKDLWDRFVAVIFIRDDGSCSEPDGFAAMYRDDGGITINTNKHGNWINLYREELDKRFKFISKKTGSILKEFPKDIKIKK